MLKEKALEKISDAQKESLYAKLLSNFWIENGSVTLIKTLRERKPRSVEVKSVIHFC